VTGQPMPYPVRSDGVAAAVCHDDVCITCSDAAVTVRIRTVLDDGLAIVDTEAGPEEISIALVETGPGDLVLVHAKEAISVVERAR
jgi:hydrogenase maturation factor